MPPTPQHYAAAALLMQEGGALEVDRAPLVSESDDGTEGAYVAAWVWVSAEDAAEVEPIDQELPQGVIWLDSTNRRHLYALMAAAERELEEMRQHDDSDPENQEVMADLSAALTAIERFFK